MSQPMFWLRIQLGLRTGIQSTPRGCRAGWALSGCQGAPGSLPLPCATAVCACVRGEVQQSLS